MQTNQSRASLDQEQEAIATNAMDVDQFGPTGLMMAPSNRMTSGKSSHYLMGGQEQMVALSHDNDTQMVRLIQQYLLDQGYSQVASQLATASNIAMEEPIVTQFRQEVLSGNFSDITGLASSLVRSSSTFGNNGGGSQAQQEKGTNQSSVGSSLVAQKREFLVTEQIRMIEYLLYEQHYMELVAKDKTLDAIQVLQAELQQRAPIQERLHELAQLILLSSSTATSTPENQTQQQLQGGADGAIQPSTIGAQSSVMENGQASGEAAMVNGLSGSQALGHHQQVVKLEQSSDTKCEFDVAQHTPKNGGTTSQQKQQSGVIPHQHNEKEVMQNNSSIVNAQHHLSEQVDQTVYANLEELRRHAPWWLGPGREGRQSLIEKVQQVLQSDSMLQPKRLQTLMQQSLSLQLSSCRYHNMHVDKFSLLSDHQCSTDVIPQKCIATLKAHKDQVWLVQFCNVKGDKLASVCKDGSLCIWHIKWLNSQGLQSVEVRCPLAVHTKMDIIQCLNWANTSDDFLVIAGKDRYANIWNTTTGKSILKLEGHQSAIQAAVFAQDDDKVFTIGTDQNLIIWSVNLKTGCKSELRRLKTKYFSDMTLKGNTLVSINKTQAYCYSFDPINEMQDSNDGTYMNGAEDSVMAESGAAKEDFMEGDSMMIDQEEYEDVGSPNVRIIEGNDTITAISLSKDGHYLLANISMTKPRIECWYLPTGENRGKYRGHEQRNYILRPAFGGLNERLVLCGSEDSSICIWHRQSCELIARIEGHFQIVNSVSWSSTNALLFASGSDDSQVKLWSVQHIEATIVTAHRSSSQKKRLTNSKEEEKRQTARVGRSADADSAEVGIDGHGDSEDDSSSSSSSSWDESGDVWARAQPGSALQQPDRLQEIDDDEEDNDDEDDEGWGDEMEEVD